MLSTKEKNTAKKGARNAGSRGWYRVLNIWEVLSEKVTSEENPERDEMREGATRTSEARVSETEKTASAKALKQEE